MNQSCSHAFFGVANGFFVLRSWHKWLCLSLAKVYY